MEFLDEFACRGGSSIATLGHEARSGRECQFKREVVRRFLARIPGFKRDVSQALRVQRTVGRCGEIDGCGSRGKGGC